MHAMAHLPSTGIVSVTLPSERILRKRFVRGDATQIAPSASKQIPSRWSGSVEAKTSGLLNDPSSPIENEINLRSGGIAAIKVIPSGVITTPFGLRTMSPLVTGPTSPFGSTVMIASVHIASGDPSSGGRGP